MSQKQTLMRTFNHQMTDFVADIVRIFPKNKEIQTMSSTVDLIKKNNPSLMIKQWLGHVYNPYRDQIDAGDYDYFFRKSYKDDLTELSNADQILGMIEKVRELASAMDETNRQHTMQYLQILSKLSEAYTQL